MEKKGFFRRLLNTVNIIRIVIINIIFFTLFFVLFSVWKTEQAPSLVDENSVLVIRPYGTIVESESDMPVALTLLQKSEHKTLLSSITDALNHAAYDRRIASVLIDFSYSSGLDFGKITEIEHAIRTYQESGKPLYMFGVYYSLKTYYLASFADRICLDPFGSIDFSGLASNPLFYKNMEEKFGVRWNVVQAGKYKAMAETFSRTKSSNAVRTNVQAALDDLWMGLSKTIIKNRNLPENGLENFTKNKTAFLTAHSGNTVQAAKDGGLITDIGSFDDFCIALEFCDKENLIDLTNSINFNDYNANFETKDAEKKIALIFLTGSITSSGAAGNTSNIADSTTIINFFEQAASREDIAAVVLRINSGGGEVFASEEIRRAVERTQKYAQKPVVVSMGSTAASGAYWIASSAHWVFATPFTITGSIGVLSVAPSFEKTLHDHFGITSDLIFAGAAPRYLSTQNKSDDERALRRLEIEHTYKQFIQTVARGRETDEAAIESHAGGQIFSGTQALSLNLVDEIGTLDDAITAAAEFADIEHTYSVEEMKKEKTFTDELLEMMLTQNIHVRYPNALRTLYELLSLSSKNGIYVYNPVHLLFNE